MLHRLFRLDPGAPAAGPAGAASQSNLNTQSLRLANCMGEKILPLLAHEIYRTARHADIDLQKNQITNTGLFHSFQIGRHFFPV